MQSVLIIEDHLETRGWLSRIVTDTFPETVVDEAGTLEQAREQVSANIYNLALVDLSLPDGSGIRLLEELQHRCPDTFLVVTTIFDDDQHLFDSLRAGASGYLLKDQPARVIAEALAGIASGKPPLTPAIARRILRHFQQPEVRSDPRPSLSDRELEVLALLAKGMARNDIARLLDISANTAAGHIKSIYRKLNVSGRAEATLEAVQMGLIPQQQRDS